MFSCFREIRDFESHKKTIKAQAGTSADPLSNPLLLRGNLRQALVLIRLGERLPSSLTLVCQFSLARLAPRLGVL